MPWNVRKRGGQWCVIKVGESSPVPGGCHPTREEAVRHQRALYAGEATAAAEELRKRRKRNGLWYVVGPKEEGMNFDSAEILDGNGNVVGFTGTNSVWTSNGAVEWTINGVPADEYFATSTLPDPRTMETEQPMWEGVLAVEGIPTSDGRYLMPGKIDWRDLPLTLMVQTVTDEGHKGAFAAGKITNVYKQERPDLGPNAVAIIGEGHFSDDDDGRRALDLLTEEIVRHVSIDFAPSARYLVDPETLEPVNEGDLGIEELLGGNFLYGFEGKIMGATMLPFSAFEEATMHIVELDDKVVVASAFPMRKVLTASAAGLAPLRPPKDWFYMPETDGPCPLTITPEGKVFGHLALWNQCHRSAAGCEMAPRSKAKYAFFHTGALTTEEGDKVNVGRITVGGSGHASVSPYLGTRGAIEHYDKTGTVGAFVRAHDGNYGIWLSGTVRSDCPAEKIRDMEANPPSGDWREENGRLELCAALSVPVAGFPVPRYEAALVASGQHERVVALVASGYTEPGPLSRADQRRFVTLKMKARKALGGS